MKKITKEISYFSQNFPITLSFSIILSALFFIVGAVPQALYFNQASIADGQLWRLITAHLVHVDLQHFFWNLTAFVILSLLIEQRSRKLLFIALLCGTLTIDYFLWFNTLDVINYAGFSGVLNTLLVVALYNQWQSAEISKRLVKLLPLAIYLASLGKIIIELFIQDSLFTHISWQPLPHVHLIGFLTGTLLVICHHRCNS